MREIKFRGKHEGKYNTYFVEGFGINKRPDGLIFIINKEDGMWYEVDCNTIGQYTGLHDKNGVEIYEGDIIQDSFYDRKAEVVFLEGTFWLDYIKDFKEYETIHKRYQLIANYDNKTVLEIIGNKFDNPELLEREE